MAFRALIGNLAMTILVVAGLVGFFVRLVLLQLVLSPFGVADQTIGAIAAVLFFVGFWGLGLKVILEW